MLPQTLALTTLPNTLIFPGVLQVFDACFVLPEQKWNRFQLENLIEFLPYSPGDFFFQNRQLFLDFLGGSRFQDVRVKICASFNVLYFYCCSW